MSSAQSSYVTEGGLVVRRRATELPVEGATEPLTDALDGRRGALFASSYEVPGRYARSEVGFVDPPLVLVGRGRAFEVAALNRRGEVLLAPISAALRGLPEVRGLTMIDSVIRGEVPAGPPLLSEEERTRQPSLFTVVRRLCQLFASAADQHLGLYGVFGYDLAFQIDPVAPRLPREAGARDLVLYLPDVLTVVDHRRARATRLEYDFVADWVATEGLPVEGADEPCRLAGEVPAARDHAPGEYGAVVDAARAAFRRGDLFEVVPSQTFFVPCRERPSQLFRRLGARNPAPYAFLVNLGEGEHLVGASPEMYLRVTGDRVETCPVAGTVARGRDPLDDADQVLRLLASVKDESELTMCTDVDRNDKSRVCVPGSVRVLGRRQIEVASRLIHTVDHVEGRLRPGYDGLDAFLAHAWAVTITGAPKLAAMQFIEDHERSPRRYYGGAVGLLAFDGRIDTGLTLRTIRIAGGIAEVRAGATLLAESDPAAEEAETELKASALLEALAPRPPLARPAAPRPTLRARVLLVDHQDSFVHTLANYLRQTGAEVITVRAGFPTQRLDELAPDLVVLSPGPRTPRHFAMSQLLDAVVARGLPAFGVCLGLQGMVEHFGGTLGVLDQPVHGKRSTIHVRGGRLLAGLPARFVAGRYHSLYARRETLPATLLVTAESEDGVPMAIEHATLPMAAVQFHPESILTAAGDVGLRLVENVVRLYGPTEKVGALVAT
jgi:anthranilate synthase